MSNYNGGHRYAIDPRELNEKPIACAECDTQRGLIECSGDCERDVCKVHVVRCGTCQEPYCMACALEAFDRDGICNHCPEAQAA